VRLRFRTVIFVEFPFRYVIELISAVNVAKLDSIGMAIDEFFVQEGVMIPAYDNLVRMRQRVNPVQLGLELCKGAFVGQVASVKENITIGDPRRGAIVRVGDADQRYQSPGVVY
jgi:hypothetical protein